MTVVARFTDRIRPWRAAEHVDGDARRVAVIGAGAAGLATAALLRRRGVDAVVFDRSDVIGGSWPGRYAAVRLNTVRWMSDLPGHRMPRRFGRWVGRDDLVVYLQDYADHHHLPVRLGAVVDRIEHGAGCAGEAAGWTVQVNGGDERFDGVVVATGHSARPTLPEWAGESSFPGRVLHSGSYRRPADHTGTRVLVVGAGSSGGEICVDLAGAGIDVTWSVRTAPRVFPREVTGMPATPFGPLADLLPDSLVDRLAPAAERLVSGPRDYLPEPTAPMMGLLARCKEPMTADGIVELVRNGSVRVVEAVERLDGRGAHLADGSLVEVDDVIAATGFHTGLEPLVGHLGVLDLHGRPTDLVPRSGLAFVGFRIPLTGTLWAIETDARRTASRLFG